MAENKMQRFADKYFLRSNQILKADNLNPWVNMQVFVRKGPGKVAGIEEAIDIITSNSNIEEVGGRIYARSDGDEYESKETLMNIIAPIQSIMELETVYLGVISSAITLENGGQAPDLDAITRNVEQVIELTNGRPVFYFGARHWHYNMDADISAAAFKGGASSCSTDEGAEPFGQKGMGTIPHALENVYAYFHGKANAVARATEAFDRYMDYLIPRITLNDYNNHEITDTLQTIYMLRSGNGLTKKLDGVRVDTCGENIAEGGHDIDMRHVYNVETKNMKYWEGEGVTVDSVYALRKALDQAGEQDVKITLSSGFGDTEKVKAFNEGERLYGVRLYDAIGAGFLDDIRTATADIVAVGNSPDEVDFYSEQVIDERFYGGAIYQDILDENVVHKVGRPPMPNGYLERIF